MISERCKGANLLNYIKQKNIEYTIDYDFVSDRNDIHWLKWSGVLIFNGKIYSDFHSKKKILKSNLVDLAEKDIKSYLVN